MCACVRAPPTQRQQTGALLRPRACLHATHAQHCARMCTHSRACRAARRAQVLASGGERFKFEHPNPFASPDEDEELASCAYRCGLGVERAAVGVGRIGWRVMGARSWLACACSTWRVAQGCSGVKGKLSLLRLLVAAARDDGHRGVAADTRLTAEVPAATLCAPHPSRPPPTTAAMMGPARVPCVHGRAVE